MEISELKLPKLPLPADKQLAGEVEAFNDVVSNANATCRKLASDRAAAIEEVVTGKPASLAKVRDRLATEQLAALQQLAALAAEGCDLAERVAYDSHDVRLRLKQELVDTIKAAEESLATEGRTYQDMPSVKISPAMAKREFQKCVVETTPTVMEVNEALSVSTKRHQKASDALRIYQATSPKITEAMTAYIGATLTI